MKRRFDSAAHNIHFRPIFRLAAQIQLASAVRTNSRNKCRRADFLGNPHRGLEFFRPMSCKAIRRPAEAACIHRHLGGVGPEMRVQPSRTSFTEPAHDAAGLGHTDEMMEQPTIGSTGDPNGEPQGPNPLQRRNKQGSQSWKRKTPHTLTQHVTSPRLLLLVFGVRRRLRPPAQRNSLDVETLPLQRQDLAADECMADFRVLVDEISDFQDRIQRRLRAGKGLLSSYVHLDSPI